MDQRGLGISDPGFALLRVSIEWRLLLAVSPIDERKAGSDPNHTQECLSYVLFVDHCSLPMALLEPLVMGLGRLSAVLYHASLFSRET